MRRTVLLVALAVVALAGCGDGGGGTVAGPRRGPNIARTDDDAVFTVDCTWDHTLQDDPIVHPRQPGMSHPHDFFGNVGADAFSTVRSLRGQRTTCEDPDDTASYWAPALYRGSRKLRPNVLRAYYRAAPGADVSEVRVPPTGLELLAGDAHARPGHWTSTSEVGWGCGLRPKRWRHQPPGDCTDNGPLTVRLVFPDCWDGEHLRSADHRSHVAYSENGRCPRDHPVPILQVQTSISYPVAGSVAHLRLGSGGWETTHGDFLNAWGPGRLRHHTDLCIRVKANCTIG